MQFYVIIMILISPNKIFMITGSDEPRILLFDFETSPDLAYVFAHSKYEQDIAKFVRPSYTLSVAHMWYGDKKVTVKALNDFPRFKKDPHSDKALYEYFSKIVEQADVLVAHNGDSFDIRVMNARMLKHGLSPLPPHRTIDTKRVAKKYLKLPSYAMNDICEYYNGPTKIETGGFATWQGCDNSDNASFNKMKKYNAHDVFPMLNFVYELLVPWMKNYPILRPFNGSCRHCSGKMIKRGMRPVGNGKYLEQRYVCVNPECGLWDKGERVLANP